MIYPNDIDEAAEVWGANCGPCSLAAVLNKSLSEVRPLMTDFPGYTTPTYMRQVLALAEIPHQLVWRRRPNNSGLVFVQWGGHDHKPVRAQYTFTHWIAVDRLDTVFDVNLDKLATWDYWKRVIPQMMKEAGRGDGSYFIRAGIILL